MYRIIKASENDLEYGYSYVSYILDEDGEEVDRFGKYAELDKAVSAATEHTDNTGEYIHIVFVPAVDPDDDPDIEEWYEEYAPFDPYEIVWSNYPD